MDFAEKIFQAIAQRWRNARQRKGPEETPGRVVLADVEPRLRMLASLLTGEVLEIRSEDGRGSYASGALLLPRQVAVFDEPDDNEAVLVYRLAFSTLARRLGLHRPRGNEDPVRRGLATLLAVDRVRDELRREYPSAPAMAARLEPAMLALRPRVEPPYTALDAVELLCQLKLGSEHAASVEGPVGHWLQRAQHARVDRAADLARHLDDLDGALADAGPRRGRGSISPCPLWGELPPADLLRPPEPDGEEDPDAQDEQQQEPQQVIDLDRTIRLVRKPRPRQEDRPLYHMFEKVETTEEHEGEPGTPDDSGDVRQLEQALDELDLGNVIRSMERPRNLVRAEVIAEPTDLVTRDRDEAAGGGVHFYPEWNHKRRSYREDWCTVREERFEHAGGVQENVRAAREITRKHRKQVEAIRGHLLASLFRRTTRNRQIDGPEIDVEAMVERHADLVAGRTPPERLHLSAKKQPREVAILVLLDTSYSTDAWLEGRRILDVEMESVITLAEALEGYVEQEVAIACFRSRTRSDCRFGLLKSFSEPWQRVRERLPGLRPDGYTRIGPAIRHASALLGEAKARDRLLLLVSDGKPTDYDQYEGRYGVEDVRQALREAHGQGIATFGLAVEKDAKYYLARMLGPGRYRILPQPAHLADAMAEVFTKALTP